ncbi:MAG TPA: DNA polymerase III subunit alpha [Alphaproteobacteria bacterium]|nr:DNA polymerase III subunit alpha [Alphaproteobacteria bacterium]
MAPGFIPLTVKTSFSLLEGMIQPKPLAKTAAKLGYPAIGITDIGNMFGAVELSKYLPEQGVQPILGTELPLWLPTAPGKQRQAGYVSLLVQNHTGWQNLCKLISIAQAAKLTEGRDGLDMSQLLEFNAGLILLSGPYHRGAADMWRQQGTLLENLTTLQQIFGDRLYVQLERHGSANETEIESALCAAATQLQLPLVATNDVRFFEPSQQTACEVLLSIGDSTTMADPNRRKLTPNHRLRTPAEMMELFADKPSALANTVHIAKRCAFLLQQVSVKKMYMPKWIFSEGEEVSQTIRREAEKGLQKRLVEEVLPLCDSSEAEEAAAQKYKARLEYELETLITMGFEGYFLITSDFIRWAKGQGIPVGPGRGSGAGSLVAWSLQITDLDPIRWNLYFERFLNPDRVSLPDFDIDFCQDRREEVIAYVRQRFGADRVAQIITFGTLKARACIRDVGRVLGLGYNFCGEVAKFIPEGANPPDLPTVLKTDERLRARYDEEEDVKTLLDTSMQLEGCYRHASTHAAGIHIVDRPITDVAPLYVDPRASLPATAFTWDDAEKAGLVKFDFLGLKTLSVIRLAQNMVQASHKPDFDIMKISLSDQTPFDMLKKGQTLGVFQIEGAGMTELTRKMQADDLEALSALIALYRPGPMEWIPQYINVRLGKEEPVYPHPLLKDTLEVTFGIAVYQEQVMQMARVLAGYTLAGADLLRRAMGKKQPEEMAKERTKFVTGAAVTNGIEEAMANSIFDQMSAFAGYGFNKAHSMAYALISYQTAWLKANYPLEFMASTMTYDRGDTDKILRYKQELGRMGYKLLPVSINKSGVFFEVQEGNLRHGLAALKGAGEEAMRRVVAERAKNGPYKNMWDLVSRNDPHTLNRRQFEVLAKAGAFDDFESNRGMVMANLDIYQNYGSACLEQRESGQTDMFGGSGGTPSADPYKQSLQPPLQLDVLQKLAFEQEAIGFYLSAHPLDSCQKELARLHSYKQLSEIEEFGAAGGGAATVAGIVLSLREVKTKAGARMAVVTLSDPTGQAEVAIFPEAYAAQGHLVREGSSTVITIKVSQDGERLRIFAERIRALEDALSERSELLITLADANQTIRVQDMLRQAGQGGTTVKLNVPTGQGRATVRLPGGFRIKPGLLANLQGLSGVSVQ